MPIKTRLRQKTGILVPDISECLLASSICYNNDSIKLTRLSGLHSCGRPISITLPYSTSGISKSCSSNSGNPMSEAIFNPNPQYLYICSNLSQIYNSTLTDSFKIEKIHPFYPKPRGKRIDFSVFSPWCWGIKSEACISSKNIAVVSSVLLQ